MLQPNWITDKIIDFEYKKYLLLAYFQDVELNFKNKVLYPYLSDLHNHYENIHDLIEKRNLLSASFTKKVIGIDLKERKLIYEENKIDSPIMEEIVTIANYSLPKFKYFLNEGNLINQYVCDNISINPVGLEPIYKLEGYFFLNSKSNLETKIFKYSSLVIHGTETDSRYMNYKYVSSEKTTLINTPEKIKLKLVVKYKELPNPAAYWVESKVDFPLDETLLPVVSRMISKLI